ncbi:hypothetical protein KA025_01125 [Candidatus Saccharibacteria bacterium]|jgi:hypothetical protein|nr:hypothetical protein [Candidatus Saccharibacteria bacterium]MBP7834669.1 hypothetical protein [Candidatus Saccharibacteria bacterium]
MNPETRLPIGNSNLPEHVVARINNIQKAVWLVECASSYSPVDQRPNISDNDNFANEINNNYSIATIDPETNRIASIARQYAQEQHDSKQFPLPDHLKNRAA